MMFRSEDVSSEAVYHSPVQPKVRSEKSNLAATEHSFPTELLQTLIPPGLSPNKRAIVEQLVTAWLAQSAQDVA